jgi:hypothetical protein
LWPFSFQHSRRSFPSSVSKYLFCKVICRGYSTNNALHKHAKVKQWLSGTRPFPLPRCAKLRWLLWKPGWNSLHGRCFFWAHAALTMANLAPDQHLALACRARLDVSLSAPFAPANEGGHVDDRTINSGRTRMFSTTLFFAILLIRSSAAVAPISRSG